MDNLPRGVGAAIGDGDAEKARIAMERVLGHTEFKLSNSNAAAAAAAWKSVGTARGVNDPDGHPRKQRPRL